MHRSLTCTFSRDPPSAIPQRAVVEGNKRPPKRKLQSLEMPQFGTRDHPNPVGFRKSPATEDETPIENTGRLLQDGGGRLCTSYLEFVDPCITANSGKQYIWETQQRYPSFRAYEDSWQTV